MFEKKRGKRFLASVMALVMLLSLAPVGALAAKEDKGSLEDAPSSATFQAVTITTNLTGVSNNGFTKAYAMWKGKNTDGTEDGKYYLAIASVGQQQKIDEDFQDKINEKFENPASYIHNNGTLSVQCGDKGFNNITPESVTGKKSDTWVILVMTPEELKQELHYNNSNGTFNLGIEAQGFDLGDITIKDETFKGTVDKDVDPQPEPDPNSTDVYVYFKIVDANGNVVDKAKLNDADLQKVVYNSNEAKCWATLGKISVDGTIADGTYGTGKTEIPQNVITAATTQLMGNALCTSNKDIAPTVLAHIQWTKLAQHNGADDYEKAGTNYWHLDGQITGYKVTYANGAGEDTVTEMPYDTTSYTDGMYYLSGSEYTVSSNVPQRTGYTFAGWESSADKTVYKTESSMKFTMPAKDVTLTAVWEEKETDPNPPTDTTKNAKYFVLMPSKGKPTSGQNQGPRNYFPNATDNGGVKYGSLTGYKGKIYTSIIQDHPEANTKDGYFVADGIESKYLVVPSDLGYFSEGYTGNFPSVLGDNFTMQGKKIIWYVVKNVVTSLTPSYHVDGYLAGVPVELRYHENFNFSGTDDVIVTVDKNGDKDLLSGETVTISGISEDITAKHPGWTFVGWTENRDGSGTVYTAGSTKVMMDSCDLYAKWTKTDPNPDPPPAPPTLVKAKFFINLGGKEASNPKGTGTFTKGIEIQGAINLDVFNRNKTGGSAYGNGGYIFNINGVETNSECTGLLNQKPEDTDINNDINAELPTNEQGSMDIGSDTGREVVWYHVSHCGDGYHVDGYIKNVDITITYNPDGGTFADGTTNNKTKQGLSGQVHTIIADIPTKSGHVFAGWKVEGDSSNKIYKNGDSITRMSDLTLVAQWEKDVWKDADKDSSSTEKDSKTGGDGIPDSQQILIEYKAYEEGNGTVDPTFEVITVKEDGKLTQTKGSTANAKTGYVFVTWSDKNAVVNETTVDSIVSSAAATTKTAKWTPTLTASDKGKTYTYTAIFLEDKVGSKNEDGSDKGDGIPDAWQYKVTFQVVNGNWNVSKNNKNIVVYVNAKNQAGEVLDSKLTASQIPAVGNEPNSGYKTSGSWDETPSVGLEIKKDTVFTFTYFRRSSSGGSSRPSTPTVTIPDNVPTGLNGKDHYAYIIGYGNNDVRPQNNITRAEVATIFFRLLTDETREANMTKSNSYNDVKDGDWFCCAVSTLSKMGIIKGYEDGSFKPNDPISRAEFAAIAARFDPDGDKTPATFADVTSHWAKDEISIAANHGWIKGYEDGSFKPDQKITRAETMTLVNRVLNRLPETKDDLHKDMKTWVDNMDETAWYYLAVQEATNSHYFKNKTGTKFEQWTDLRDTRDWSELEK